jgi:hypothetical protein
MNENVKEEDQFEAIETMRMNLQTKFETFFAARQVLL